MQLSVPAARAPAALLPLLLLLLVALAARAEVNVTVLVVGKVSSDSANVLLELQGADGEVEQLCAEAPQEVLQLADRPGRTLHTVDHDVNCSVLAARRPVVFFFEKLPAGTNFSIVLAPGVVAKHQGRLRTHGDTASDDVVLGVVSCNAVSLTAEGEIKEQEDLWRNLEKRVHDGQLTGVLHVGDQVYIDNDRHVLINDMPEDGSHTKKQILKWCAWCRWEEKLKDKGKSEWSPYAEDIREDFRDIYRMTWSHGPTAYVLANTMNMFVVDDHAFRDDLGDEEQDRDNNSLDFFLATLAFEVAWDYQYAAMGPWSEPLSRAYHNHTISDSIGILFLDVRLERSVLYEAESPQNEEKLGQRQWRDFKSALTGRMSGVDVLIVVSPVPLIYTSKEANDVLRRQVDDFKGAWAAAPEEQSALLDLLVAWQKERDRRRIVLVAGDVHHGGHTAVMDKAHQEFYFGQLTSSAIANTELTWKQEKVIELLRDGLSESLLNHSYRHDGWTSKRNFGTLSIRLRPDGKAGDAAPEVIQSLYSTDGDYGEVLVSTYSGGIPAGGSSQQIRFVVVGVVLVVLCLALAALACCCKDGYQKLLDASSESDQNGGGNSLVAR